MNPLSLGILFIALGLVFWAITRLLIAFVPRMTSAVQPDSLPAGLFGLEKHEHAVLIVQTGGKLLSLNAAARNLFQLSENEIPGLERLARRLTPAEQFLSLCAAEGQARFMLDGRLLEGVSYIIENKGELVRIISLRAPERDPGLSDASGSGSPFTSLGTFTELSQAMSASLNLQETLNSILTNLEKLLPLDHLEINLWDVESETLLPYRSAGVRGLDRKMEPQVERRNAQQGITGYITRERVPVFVANTSRQAKLPGQPVNFAHLPVRSYIGVPLLAGQEFIGTLEIGALAGDAFHENDLEMIRLLSRPAAVALHNALLYREEQRRAAELTGLAQLSQAIGSARDSQTMFARLVQSIVPLIEVEILGFLIYNENERVLHGQVPFFGLPPQFVEIYRVPVLPNSAAEQTMVDQDVILTENAAEDGQWEQLGLEHLAQAASLRDTALVPLVSAGRMLGYLQASNHTNGAVSFSQDEMHLLMIAANQAAPVIENATLVQVSRQRAQRAEGLRRIASLTSSAATLDEILLYSLQELARLLRADIAAAFFLDSARVNLQLHRPSLCGKPAELPERMTWLATDDAQFSFTVTGSQHTITSDRLLEDRPIIPYYQQIRAIWQVESFLAAPLVVRDEGIGEIWLGSRKQGYFDSNDLQVVVTACGQLAGVVEQSYLADQTDAGLRKRVDQLISLTRVSRELNAAQEPTAVLEIIYAELLRITHADCAVVALLRAGKDNQLEIVDQIGEPLASLSAFEQEILHKGEPLLVSNLSKSEVPPPHSGVETLLYVPVFDRQKVIGLLGLHSRRIDCFDQSMVDAVVSLAAQAGSALGNSYRYEIEQQRAQLMQREIHSLNQLMQVLRELVNRRGLVESLAVIANGLQAATGFETVVISLLDGQTGDLYRAFGTGISAQEWHELQQVRQPWSHVRQLFLPEFKVSSAFFIPNDRQPAVVQEIHSLLVSSDIISTTPGNWHPEDILLVPLYQSTGEPLGLISLDKPYQQKRPDSLVFDALEMFSMVAALTIENQRRYQMYEEQLLLAEELQRENPLQASTIRSLSRQVDQLSAGLEIAEMINRQTSAKDVLHTLGEELIRRFGMQVVLLGERTSQGPNLIEILGSVPVGVNLEPLFGQRNPLRQLMLDERMMLVTGLQEDPDWSTDAMVRTLNAATMIGIPLVIGDGRLAGVMAFSDQERPPFSESDRHLFMQLTSQVGIALQNMQLLTETRRRLKELDLMLEFSRELGSFEPSEILNTLIQNVRRFLPHAEATWAAVWDAHLGQLANRAADGYSDNQAVMQISYDLNLENQLLPVQVYQTGRSIRADEIDFARDYQLTTNDLMHYRQATGGRVPISCLFIPISRGDRVLGVMGLDNFNAPAAFSEDDEILALSLAQQAALALESARLYADVEERAAQMEALTSAAGVITGSLQSQALINSLLGELAAVVPCDTATLWLRSEGQLTVAAANGFQDNERRIGLSVNLEDSRLFQAMLSSGKPLLVGDVRTDDRFMTLLEPDHLSWLGIPLIAKSELIGILALEKQEDNFYSPVHIQVATTFAGQAAVALENAHLFEESQHRAAELDQRSRRLALLNQFSSNLGASLDVDHTVQLAASQVQQALEVSQVAVVFLESDGSLSVAYETGNSNAALPIHLPANPWTDRLAQTQGVYRSDIVQNESELEVLKKYWVERNAVSLLVLPLSTGAILQGWMWLMQNQPRSFNLAEVDLARTIANQAGMAVQNARLYLETRTLTADLERRVEVRTAELRREHHNSETLLRIITELSASLDVDQVMQRTLNVLNEALGADQAMVLLTQGANRRYQAGEQLLQNVKAGKSPADEIARWVNRQRSGVVITNAETDGRWDFCGSPVGFSSAVAVPLQLGEESLGALLLFHTGENRFVVDQINLAEAAARQIAITLNNAELFNLIRDQSEHLGSMLREQQMEASRSRAILESVADGVVVTNAALAITLFNVSAERILSLTANDVNRKSLTDLGDLMGSAAQKWVRAIREISADPTAAQGSEPYAEQIELDNKRVVAIRLAPVYWRNDFLGTVTIFRDITHQVQVDRMKSEFVANVSHELRTPMTSIKGYVEIMLMGAAGDLTDPQKRFLGIVKSNTERLTVLVNDLLDVSRIEAGHVSLNITRLSLQMVVENVLSDIVRRSREENKEIQFTMEIEPDLPMIMADRERIHQVISHLAMNGYNYTPAGGEVQIRARRVNGDIQVDVQDNGIGIAAKDRPRVFERFFRGTDPLVLATAGNGLGLAMAKTLIEMHQGHIWYESEGEPGKGSIFSFTLPVLIEDNHGENTDR